MKDGRKGCFYGLGTYPPGPLSYKERGSIACLMDENKGCFNGFERGRYAIKNPSHSLSQNPSAFPSSQAQA